MENELFSDKEVDLVKMERCLATTKSGRRCKNHAQTGRDWCGIHYQEQDAAIRCQCVQRNGLQCRLSGQHQMNGDWMCNRHYRFYTQQQEQRAAEDILGHVIQDLHDGVYIRDLEDRIDEGFRAGFYNHRHRDIMLEILHHEHGWIEMGRQFMLGPVHIANDPQNVHRTEVSEQTNKGLEILLNTPVPPKQDIFGILATTYPPNDKMIKDMRKWYKQRNCREENDWLYKRTLDGLWAYIVISNHRVDLLQRLFEEATESIGMCCDGHITRLVNVLVGFDDRVEPSVPVGELLQQRIALISEKEISLHEKVMEALTCMQELNVPAEEQNAWIEAL